MDFEENEKAEGAGMSTFGNCPKQNIYEDICYQKEQNNIPKSNVKDESLEGEHD